MPRLNVWVACSCLAISGSVTAQSGVDVMYRGPVALSLHEPVVAEFSVDNRLSEATQFDMGFDRKQNVVITVRQPNGSVAQLPSLPRHDGMSVIGRVSVPPMEKYEQRLVLNEWYSFDQPGLYQVTIQLQTRFVTAAGAVLGSPQVGVLQFSIGPRNEAQLQQICQRLAERVVTAYTAQDRLDSALALSFVSDPVGIWWMQWVLWRTDASDAAIIRGLMRIGDAYAQRVLAEVAAFNDPVRAAEARRALAQLASQAK